jgi:hypothetical protein
MGVHMYPKHWYLLLKLVHECGQKLGLVTLKYILFQFGFGYIWISHNVGDDSNFIKTFTQLFLIAI